MSPRLLPCPGCERHVRVTESLCPFCGDALPLAYQGVGAANLPTKRLGRAAKFAFGAAVAGAMAVSGCGDDTDPPADSGTVTDSGSATDSGMAGDASPDAADDSGMVALYGGPPADSGIGSDAGDAATDAGDSGMLDSAVGALYGGAPVDAG